MGASALTQISCSSFTPSADSIEQSKPRISFDDGSEQFDRRRDSTAHEDRKRTIESLRPLHRRLAEPSQGDWLYSHEESGPAFAESVRTEQSRGPRIGSMIRVLPLGEFSDSEREIVRLSARWLRG